MEFKRLISDDGFIKLMSLMGEFCDSERGIWWQTCQEVISSITMPQKWVTLFSDNDDGDIFCYITGVLSGPPQYEFFVTQILNRDANVSQDLFASMERMLREMGVKEVTGSLSHNPRVYRHYGYEVKKYIVSKML